VDGVDVGKFVGLAEERLGVALLNFGLPVWNVLGVREWRGALTGSVVATGGGGLDVGQCNFQCVELVRYAQPEVLNRLLIMVSLVRRWSETIPLVMSSA
jgi:hypothetical protein